MKKRTPTVCPIVYALDIWGDPWSLIILRDVLIHNKRHYREFLASREGIATNILSARLQSLTDAGLLVKIEGASSRAQTMYRPTQKALDLFPVVFAVMRWGLKYNPDTDMEIPIMQELISDEKGLERRLLQNFDDVTS
ncbi:helix-turn-helix transcriptional regulator [Paenibacillus sp. CGMCC 1.16610]|uniref:Helix-turn-helix domain-containing protein n=2 Tax=Paenibacillus TaxID=44249 RepID=A0ABU6DB41_9BACL|nr:MULTISPECIES: helix-turn-helix domain-containing protein [Paenibacillus]MBA2943282.1 helix-turn-helix transcriptional regulator [Paenibacillus sp. CGMCC 1.16610]MCY9663303.1 helix-turn-helix transcriptional regulator [Paenibacillus anseongense]MEB4794938.1 helix-turn-helix domain-containing protein [Paenibacillus chondroitinus]MVQ33780.1 transcriptional regulator [Paenibacillus anseongense]